MDGVRADDELRADCARCVGLCCVVPAFAASADFAFAKPARTPCPNLLADARCGVHDRLRDVGMPGCATFDCLGAGQRVVEVTFGGAPPDPATDPRVGEAFEVMRALHEMLVPLEEASTLVDDPLAAEVGGALAGLRALTGLDADGLRGVDTGARRRTVGELLGRVSRAVRGPGGRDLAGTDRVGRRLEDLRHASLRGALLLGADLRGADLHRADLLGADLRGADLRGARLDTALFVTGPQLAAARGDGATGLPAHLPRPAHWPR